MLISIGMIIYHELFSGFFRSLRELKRSSQYRFTMNRFLSKGSLRFEAYVDGRTQSFCPITAVAHFKKGQLFGETQYREAAVVLGLSKLSAEYICEAADEVGFGRYGPLRKWMKLTLNT